MGWLPLVPGFVLLVVGWIAATRFFGAYLERYGRGKPAGAGPLWSWGDPFDWSQMLRPPYSLPTLFRRLDDPVVDRLRRRYQIALLVYVWYLVVLFAAMKLFPQLFA